MPVLAEIAANTRVLERSFRILSTYESVDSDKVAGARNNLNAKRPLETHVDPASDDEEVDEDDEQPRIDK